MTLTLARQALILTLGNALTRGLGFLLHLALARFMGAQALGVMEMANSVGMLALTPVTAGIPSAVSRLTSLRPRAEQPQVLHAGRRVVLRWTLWLIPLLALLSPALSWFMGDMRTLPAVLLTLPDILLLGLCSVYCGYCYGQENTLLPAAAECAEQGVRFALTLALVLALRRASVGVMAALPGLAEAVAALCSVLLLRRSLPVREPHPQPCRDLQLQIHRLATPLMLARLCQTAARALNAVLLPVCLRRSGLSAGAATAQFGLLNGMAMPLMLLPGVVTGALCMIASPAISRNEGCVRELRCTMRRLLLPAAVVGVVCGAALFLLSDFIGRVLYRTAALGPLLRILTPAAVLFSLHQVQIGMIAGLGLQRRSLTGTLLSSAASLLLTALLAPQPQLRLFGAALASMLGSLVSVVWDGCILRRACGALPSKTVPECR